MGNSLLTISMITKESLRILKNELGFSKGVNRQYDKQFAETGAKIGSVLNIRKPVRWNVSNGPALVIQDVTDQSVALTLSSQKHVGFQFSSKDLTLSVDEFSDRYLKTAINALANQIDQDGLALASNVWNAVGTPGTTPASFAVMAAANQKLSENAAPTSDRSGVLNPAGESGLTTALTGLFQSATQISEQYEKGVMGISAGIKWKMDQNVQVHTVGSLGGTPVVDGANQTGSSLITSGWSDSITDCLNAGDVFTIAGVYAVNPVSFQSTGSLKQFVVTSAMSTSVSGVGTISISPSIVTSGPYQTVTAVPANNASITVLGAANTSTAMNIAYHRDAFVLGMADLELPGGVEMADRSRDPDAGLAIRVVRNYDIVNDQHPCRLDVLYGWEAVYPELACRIQG